MANDFSSPRVLLSACHELLEAYPESLRIQKQVEALEEAMPDHPDVVVSYCGSIIETVCKTILTDKGIPFDRNWDKPKLVKETLRYLNLGLLPDGNFDRRLDEASKKLTSGINQIVDGLATIRNDHGSAAHGADAYSPLLGARYAVILAHATDAVVGLLFKTHLGSARRDPLTRFRYGEHTDFDERIDNDFGPFEVLGVPLIASAALYHTDFSAYRAALVQFRQEQEENPNEAENGERAE